MGTETTGVANQPDMLLTRAALAKHLMVSVSTVDRMLADGEITPIRLRGKLVRFHLSDVLAELREKAQSPKHGCARRI
jgi:excisionase family DNA binding protein